MQKERMSNFELLRIIAIIMIIAHHMFLYGFKMDENLNANSCWMLFCGIWGKIGVCLFIFISGYFANNKASNVKQILKIWGEMFFYSIVSYMFALLYFDQTFNVKDLVKYCFPFTFKIWWYASCYILLLVFSPYVKVMLDILTDKQLFKLIITLVVLFSILPTLTNQSVYVNEFIWILALWILGFSIKRFSLYKFLTLNSKFYFIASIIVTFIIWFSAVILLYLQKDFPFLKNHVTHFYQDTSTLILLDSFFIFCGFKNMKLKQHHLINLIAKTTFGIYLFHDNPVVRIWLWGAEAHRMNSFLYLKGVDFIFLSILFIGMIFVVGFIIDEIRINSFEKIWNIIINKVINYIWVPINQLFN